MTEALTSNEQLLRAALQSLADAVGTMRVPQTVTDAALLVGVTLGPVLARAREVLASTAVETRANTQLDLQREGSAETYPAKAVAAEATHEPASDDTSRTRSSLSPNEPPARTDRRIYPPKHTREVTAIVGDLIRLAAEIVRCDNMPSFDSFYQSTPIAERRRVTEAADKAHEQCKVWALRLRTLVDKLPGTADEAPAPPQCNGLCQGHSSEASTSGWLPNAACPVHGVLATLRNPETTVPITEDERIAGEHAYWPGGRAPETTVCLQCSAFGGYHAVDCPQYMNNAQETSDVARELYCPSCRQSPPRVGGCALSGCPYAML